MCIILSDQTINLFLFRLKDTAKLYISVIKLRKSKAFISFRRRSSNRHQPRTFIPLHHLLHCQSTSPAAGRAIHIAEGGRGEEIIEWHFYAVCKLYHRRREVVRARVKEGVFLRGVARYRDEYRDEQSSTIEL